MKLNCTLETRLSKSGKEYQVVVIKLTDKSEKLVFLSPAELELLRVYNQKNVNNEFFELPQ